MRFGRNGRKGLCFWPVVYAQGRAQSTPCRIKWRDYDGAV